MFDLIEPMLERLGGLLPMLPIFGVGIGAMIVVFALDSILSDGDAAVRRMADQARTKKLKTADTGLLRHVAEDPAGLLRGLIPKNRKERSDVQRALALAGFTGQHSVRNYYLARATIGIFLPLAMLAFLWCVRAGIVGIPFGIETLVAGLSPLRMMQFIMILVAVGFFGPAYWLRSRAAKRRRAIEEAFPNAIDLIQISVEAGLGFDAAMIRVGNELMQTSPEIAEELLAAQREIQAGRSRDQALMEMAERTGVEEVTAFSNVVLQSIQFGTSISSTLTTYAREMRSHRELRAQEKANKLPVQMSAVMATLMLPALLLLTLGPVLIRYSHIGGQ